MKLLKSFSNFLVNKVNLDQTRLDLLEQRVKAIVDYLKSDPIIGPMYENHIPQGSWAHQTIIKPVGENDEFDADFLLHLEEDLEWSMEPRRYLRELRAAFKRSKIYAEMVEKKNRCVRVVYANDCHIDVVPFLVKADHFQVIVNYKGNCFEPTNPQGFTAWMKEKDGLANGNFRRVIRLMKYLRDYKNTFSCPSIILTTLLGKQIQAVNTELFYSDLPTALVAIITRLRAWLELRESMPSIEDPSCPGTTFDHKWNQEQYSNFRLQMKSYSTRIAAAYFEPDVYKSLAKWRDVFGDGFQLAKEDLSETPVSRQVQPGRNRAPREEFIEDKGFALELNSGYTAEIQAKVKKKDGFRHGPLRKFQRPLWKNLKLGFSLKTDVPQPYDVYWKVRNRGDEAAKLNQLRGELIKGNDYHKESTQYTGRHYIEVYVVKDGKVLASDHHEVNIA